MAKTKPHPLLDQANSLTLVRYGPELSALTALLRQAQTDRTQAIQGARSSASLIQSAVDQSRPDVRANYRGAAKTAATQQALVTPAIVGTGTPFAAAAQIESSGLNTQLASSRARDLSDLDRRRIAAAEGAAYARTAANRAYNQTAGQIGQRAQDLANEEGAYTSSTLQTLRSAAASARAQQTQANARLTQQERDSIRSAGQDPDKPLKGGGYAPIPGGRLDPKAPKNKPKPGSSVDKTNQRQATQQFSAALAAARTLDPDANPANRQHIRDLLLSGSKPLPLHDSAGKPRYGKGGVPLMTPAVPQVQQAYAAAALDMYYDGRLSQNTVNMLHQLHVAVHDIPGVRTIATAGPKPDPAQQAQQRVDAAPNNWIYQLAAALNAGAGVPGPPRKPPVRPRHP